MVHFKDLTEERQKQAIEDMRDVNLVSGWDRELVNSFMEQNENVSSVTFDLAENTVDVTTKDKSEADSESIAQLLKDLKTTYQELRSDKAVAKTLENPEYDFAHLA